MPVHKFKVDITCGGCAATIEKVLGKLGSQIEKVDIDVHEKTVLVTSNMASNEILEAIKKTGKTTEFIGVQ